MTSETQKPPSTFARAEAGSRQIVLQIGLGVVAFILGSIISVGAASRIGERLGPLESDGAAWVFRWFFERLWLFAVAPMFGYVIGRFTEMKPTRFALVALISGETFSVLLVTAINGVDFLMQDTSALVGRGVTLFLGMGLTTWAVQLGRDAAGLAQADANVIAEKRKAEYAEFLAAAEGKSVAPAALATALPLPEGERAEEKPSTVVPSPEPVVAPTSSAEASSVSPLPGPLPRGGEGEK